MEKQNTYVFVKAFIWILVLSWTFMIGFDYFRSKNELTPFFCLSRRTKELKNGALYECIGLGYKYYRINSDTFNGIKFGGFWIDETFDQNK